MRKTMFILLMLLLSIDIYASDTKIGTYERLGNYVPLNLKFTDDHNQTKTLGEFMNGLPTVITMNYYHCPGICGPQIDSLAKSLNTLKMVGNKEYKALTISFVNTDTPKDAKEFKANHVAVLRKGFNPNAWDFLVSHDQKTIIKLSKALGYEYKKIKNKQGVADYIHPIGLVILSPKGEITRYLKGINYLSFDLEMALLESAKGEIRPSITRALSFCYSFQPKSGRYVIEYKKIFGVVVTIMMLLIFLYFYLTGIKKRKNQEGDHIDE